MLSKGGTVEVQADEGFAWIRVGESNCWTIGQLVDGGWYLCGDPIQFDSDEVVVGPAVRAERKQLHASQTFNGTT